MTYNLWCVSIPTHFQLAVILVVAVTIIRVVQVSTLDGGCGGAFAVGSGAFTFLVPVVLPIRGDRYSNAQLEHQDLHKVP